MSFGPPREPRGDGLTRSLVMYTSPSLLLIPNGSSTLSSFGVESSRETLILDVYKIFSSPMGTILPSLVSMTQLSLSSVRILWAICQVLCSARNVSAMAQQWGRVGRKDVGPMSGGDKKATLRS